VPEVQGLASPLVLVQEGKCYDPAISTRYPIHDEESSSFEPVRKLSATVPKPMHPARCSNDLHV
jgi:hypothetical protein